MDTFENDNEAFITQLAIYGTRSYEFYGYC